MPSQHRTMADYCSMVRWHNGQSKPEQEKCKNRFLRDIGQLNTLGLTPTKSATNEAKLEINEGKFKFEQWREIHLQDPTETN